MAYIYIVFPTYIVLIFTTVYFSASRCDHGYAGQRRRQDGHPRLLSEE